MLPFTWIHIQFSSPDSKTLVMNPSRILKENALIASKLKIPIQSLEIFALMLFLQRWFSLNLLEDQIFFWKKSSSSQIGSDYFELVDFFGGLRDPFVCLRSHNPFPNKKNTFDAMESGFWIILWHPFHSIYHWPKKKLFFQLII